MIGCQENKETRLTVPSIPLYPHISSENDNVNFYAERGNGQIGAYVGHGEFKFSVPTGEYLLTYTTTLGTFYLVFRANDHAILHIGLHSGDILQEALLQRGRIITSAPNYRINAQSPWVSGSVELHSWPGSGSPAPVDTFTPDSSSSQPLVKDGHVDPSIEQLSPNPDSQPTPKPNPTPVPQPTPTIPPQRCVGAVGPQCAWVNNGIGDVSVGSILHDNCCIFNYPNGHMCNNDGDDSIFSYCVPEWNKAVFDKLKGFQWNASFSGEPDNLTKVSARLSDPKSLLETVATSRLKAPEGTKLGVMDWEFCESGTFKDEDQKYAQGFGTCGPKPTPTPTPTPTQTPLTPTATPTPTPTQTPLTPTATPTPNSTQICLQIQALCNKYKARYPGEKISYEPEGWDGNCDCTWTNATCVLGLSSDPRSNDVYYFQKECNDIVPFENNVFCSTPDMICWDPS